MAGENIRIRRGEKNPITGSCEYLVLVDGRLWGTIWEQSGGGAGWRAGLGAAWCSDRDQQPGFVPYQGPEGLKLSTDAWAGLNMILARAWAIDTVKRVLAEGERFYVDVAGEGVTRFATFIGAARHLQAKLRALKADGWVTAEHHRLHRGGVALDLKNTTTGFENWTMVTMGRMAGKGAH